MAKKGNRINVKFKSTESGHCYYSTKNRVNSKDKIEIKKFDPVAKKHAVYKEAKLK